MPPSNNTQPPTNENHETAPVDIPKILGRVNAVKGIVVGGFLVLIGLVAGIYIFNSQHQTLVALAVFGVFAAMGAVAIILSVISYKQLTKAQKNPTSYNQFQTSTAAQYNTPLGKAVVAPGESIGNWLGPVNALGKAGASFQAISKEIDNQAINTLLFTSSQVIGVMVVPGDLPATTPQGVGGILGDLANKAIQYGPEGAVQKDVQFEALNSSHWDQIVNGLKSQPIEVLMQSHLNFGLPYNKIQSVEVKNSILNPGMIFHLTDGSKLSYSTMLKSQIPIAADFIKQYVSVQS